MSVARDEAGAQQLLQGGGGGGAPGAVCYYSGPLRGAGPPGHPKTLQPDPSTAR